MPSPPLCVVCQKGCNSKMPIISCSGHCTLSYHMSCVNIPLELKDFLKTVPGLGWRCEICRQTGSNVEGIISTLFDKFALHVSDKFVTLEEKLEARCSNIATELRTQLDKLPIGNASSQDTSAGPSYATVTSASSQTRLIVKPKGKVQTLPTTKLEIMQKVDPVNNNINIKGVKPTRDGGIIVGCGSIADSQKFLSVATKELSKDYEVKTMNAVLASVRIVGLSDKLDPDLISLYLRKQHEHLFSDDSVCKVMKVESVKSNPSVFYALLKVDKVLYHKLLELGHLLIGLDSCSVYDAFTITRCYCCNEFNHIASKCSHRDNPICSKCSGNHQVKDCNVEEKDFCCSNCLKYNEKHQTSLETSHAAWNYSKCKTYSTYAEKMRKSVFGDIPRETTKQ